MFLKKQFEDTRIRGRKSQKDRQYNEQKWKKDKIIHNGR